MVFRVNKTKDYAVMSKFHLKEKEMSLKAKGLLSQMLSLPDEWDYSIKGLAAINKESEETITTILKELQKFHYLVVTKKMPNETKSGRIEYLYDIYEKPYTEKQEGKKQGVVLQGVEKQGVEIQEVENSVQLNTNTLNTKQLNNKELNTKRIKEKEIYKESKDQQLLDIYNEKCTNLPKVLKLTDTRKKEINKFLKEFNIEDFKKICENANNSEWLTGGNDRGWKADFSFLMRIDKATKLLEGGYAPKSSTGNIFLDIGKDEGII